MAISNSIANAEDHYAAPRRERAGIDATLRWSNMEAKANNVAIRLNYALFILHFRRFPGYIDLKAGAV